jgi:Mu-like prophage major head subunit gpT
LSQVGPAKCEVSYSANTYHGITLSDGHPVFDAAHSNLQSGSGAVLSVTTFAEAVAALRRMKGADDTTPINVQPAFLQVGPGQELAALQLLRTLIYPEQTSNANPYANANNVTLLVSPYLDDISWRVIASPASVPTLVTLYLSGAQGPTFESRPTWDVLGLSQRCVFDFNCTILDDAYKGCFMNEGHA